MCGGGAATIVSSSRHAQDRLCSISKQLRDFFKNRGAELTGSAMRLVFVFDPFNEEAQLEHNPNLNTFLIDMQL